MTRVAAWAAVGVLVVGLSAVGVLVVRDDQPSRAVVTASRGQPGTVDVTSTVTIPLGPAPSTPPTTALTTTTLPRAAVDVLKAIGSTTTTTRPRATTTTAPPSTPATTIPTPTTVVLTTTTAPAQYNVKLVNDHPHAFVVVINGREFPLASRQTVESVDLPVSPRGDSIQVRLAEDANCGVFDSGVIFQTGGRYQVRVVEGPGMCGTFPSPFIEVSPR